MDDDRIKIFISYAHEDDDIQRKLTSQLKILPRCAVWSDRAITGGQEWHDKIMRQLESADIVLLLLSASFLNSDFIAGVEIPQALQMHRDKKTRVVPVLGRPVEWEHLPLARLQAFPADGKWMDSRQHWSSLDEAAHGVARSIKTVIAEIDAERQREREKRTAAEEDYRREVAEALSDHRISQLERETLEEARERLGLDREVAERIEAGEMQPIEEKRKNLRKYEQAVALAIDEYGYPFSLTARDDLGKRQSKLGLQDEDVIGVAERIAAQRAAERQAAVEPPPAAPPRAADPAPPAAAHVPAPPPPPAPAPAPVTAPTAPPVAAPVAPPVAAQAPGVSPEDTEAAWAEALGQGLLRVLGDWLRGGELQGLHLAPKIPKNLLDHVTRKNKVGEQVLALLSTSERGKPSDGLVLGTRGIMFTGSSLSPGRLVVSYAELTSPDLDLREDGDHLQVADARYVNLDLLEMPFYDVEMLFERVVRVAALHRATREANPGPVSRADAAALAEHFADQCALHEALLAESDAAWVEVWRGVLVLVLMRCLEQKVLPLGTLHVAPDIPAKKLRNAKTSMAFPDWDVPFGLLDVTVFGSASDGVLFGTHGMYLHNAGGTRPGAHSLYYTVLVAGVPLPSVQGFEVLLPEGACLSLGGADGQRVLQLFEALREMRLNFQALRENHPEYLREAQVNAVVQGLADRARQAA